MNNDLVFSCHNVSIALIYSTAFIFEGTKISFNTDLEKKKKESLFFFSFIRLVICSFMCIHLLSILKDSMVTGDTMKL